MKKVTINNVSMPAIGIGTWNMGCLLYTSDAADEL